MTAAVGRRAGIFVINHRHLPVAMLHPAWVCRGFPPLRPRARLARSIPILSLIARACQGFDFLLSSSSRSASPKSAQLSSASAQRQLSPIQLSTAAASVLNQPSPASAQNQRTQQQHPFNHQRPFRISSVQHRIYYLVTMMCHFQSFYLLTP